MKLFEHWGIGCCAKSCTPHRSNSQLSFKRKFRFELVCRPLS